MIDRSLLVRVNEAKFEIHRILAGQIPLLFAAMAVVLSSLLLLLTDLSLNHYSFLICIIIILLDFDF
ncbi:hypothetical protein HanIR_Chr10g0496861 [Helianthus annuus]|nr:hypothetical protein HanIR_Chr10g0496861 [Helianthus annuus]